MANPGLLRDFLRDIQESRDLELSREDLDTIEYQLGFNGFQIYECARQIKILSLHEGTYDLVSGVHAYFQVLVRNIQTELQEQHDIRPLYERVKILSTMYKKELSPFYYHVAKIILFLFRNHTQLHQTFQIRQDELAAEEEVQNIEEQETQNEIVEELLRDTNELDDLIDEPELRQLWERRVGFIHYQRVLCLVEIKMYKTDRNESITNGVNTYFKKWVDLQSDSISRENRLSLPIDQLYHRLSKMDQVPELTDTNKEMISALLSIIETRNLQQDSLQLVRNRRSRIRRG